MITPRPVYEPMLAAVRADPNDRITWSVLADMLDDHGDPRAALVRLRLEVLDAAAAAPFPTEADHGSSLLEVGGTGWPGLLAATAVFRDATTGWGHGFDPAATPPVEPRLVRYELYACRLITRTERNPVELPEAESIAIRESYGDYQRRVRGALAVTRAYATMRAACVVRRAQPTHMAAVAALLMAVDEGAGATLTGRYGVRVARHYVVNRCKAVAHRAWQNDVWAAYAAVDKAFDAAPADAPYTPVSAKRLRYLVRRRDRPKPK